MRSIRTRRGAAALTVLAVAGLGLAGCADDSGDGGGEVSGTAPGAGKPECAQLEQFGDLTGKEVK